MYRIFIRPPTSYQSLLKPDLPPQRSADYLTAAVSYTHLANNQMEAEIKKLDEVWKWLLVHKLDSSMRRDEDRQ